MRPGRPCGLWRPATSAQAGQQTTAGGSDRGTGLPAPGLVTEEAVQEVARRIGVNEEKVRDLAQRTVVNVLPKAIGVKLLDTSNPGWEDDPDRASYIEHLIPAQTKLACDAQTLVANTVVAQPARDRDRDLGAGAAKCRVLTSRPTIG